MFAFAGQSPPLHYYFFWYVLCAQIALLTGTGARAAFAASCAGSALSLLACILLSLKYLVGSRGETLRRQATAALFVGCVIGLDVIVAVIDLLLPRTRLYPDLQFWLDDRSPTWLSAFMWAPHHIAGMVCCIIGILLALRVKEAAGSARVWLVVLGGVCFAAACGTSSFITLLMAIVCAGLVIDAAFRREWQTIFAMAGVGACGILLAAPYLHFMMQPAMTGMPAKVASHVHLLSVRLRASDQAHHFIQYVLYSRKHLTPPVRSSMPQMILRLPVMLAMYIAEQGFYLFVLILVARQTLFKRGPMNERQRRLWVIFVSLAIPAFLLTSAGTTANNDFGRHAALCMRFILLLWAAPIVAGYLRQRRWLHREENAKSAWFRRAAVAAFVIGLLGQVWQIVINRIDFPLVSSGLAPQYVPTERVPDIARRFEQFRLAMEAASRSTPANGIVQGNQHGRFSQVMLMYTDRRMAASDDGCNIPFGGDLSKCKQEVSDLIRLFGGSGPRLHGESTESKVAFSAEETTPEAFRRICAAQRLSAVVANYTDPAWRVPGTWVWLLKPVYANGTARVFLCPGADQVQSNSPAPL
jgi:hypothetical protein